MRAWAGLVWTPGWGLRYPLDNQRKGWGYIPGGTHATCLADCSESRAGERRGGDLELQGGFIPLPGQPVKAAGQGAAKGKLGRQDWQSQAVVDEGTRGGNRAGGQRGDF